MSHFYLELSNEAMLAALLAPGILLSLLPSTRIIRSMHLPTFSSFMWPLGTELRSCACIARTLPTELLQTLIILFRLLSGL